MSDASNTTGNPGTSSTSGASARIQQIGGFELITKVGQGAMGTVFKARQTSLDRIVALKVLPPQIAKDATFIERFQREARASAKLNHPNIVQGIDVGKDVATGLWYFAMEFVDGPTLKTVLEQQKVLPERRALELVRDVAKALEAVAANNMVHRDIKPDNILITSRGETKLADLGLAREMKEDASVTQSGKAVGTPFYMAPEQVRGQIDQIDIRTDMYALGATLFHLVTGRPPFTGATSALIMSMHLTEAPPKAKQVNPEVSDACSRLIDKMMQKKPEQRFQTPAELVRQIERVISREATGEARPITAQVPPVEFKRRNSEVSAAPAKSKLGALVGVAAVLAIGVVAFLFKGGNAKPDSTVATSNATNKPRVNKDAPEKAPAVKPPKEHAPKKQPKEKPAEVAVEAKPAVAPQAVPAATPKVSDAAALFAQAQELEQKSPEAFNEILAAYQKADKAADGTELEDKIEDAMSATQQRLAAAAGEAWKSIVEKATAAKEAGDYDGALAAIQSMPKAFSAALGEKADAQATALHKEAEEKVNAAVKRIEELSESADPAEGLKVLAEVETIKYAPTAGAIAALKTKLNGDLANVAALKEKRQQLLAEKRLDEVLQNFELAMQEPGTKAQDIAAEARKDPALAPLKEKVDAMAQVAAAVDEVAKLVHQSLEKMKGQKVSLDTKTGKIAGKVSKIQDGSVYLDIDFGGGAVGTKAVKIADLTDDQRRTFSGSISPATDAQRVASAIAKMVKGKEDLGSAVALLAQAPNFPLTQYFQDKFTRRQADAAKTAHENAAGPAWAEIYGRTLTPKISDAEAKVVLAKIEKFEKDYGETQFAAAIDDKISALKSRLSKVGIINLVKNGDFENGLVAPWSGRDTQTKLQISAVEAHSGRAAMYLSPRRNSEFGTQIETETGATYKFSAWVKAVKATRGVRVRTRIDDQNILPQTDLTGNMGWQHLTGTFTATRKQTRLDFSFRMPESEQPEVYFDDIELIKVDGPMADGMKKD